MEYRLPKTGFGMMGMIWKYKFWIMLILVLLPSVIQSIQVAIQTDNPTYPFFQLAIRIFSADSVLDKDVATLQKDPSLLIGMAHPDHGLWQHTVFFWKLFYNVIWEILGTIWLIFFPFTLIYKIVSGRDTGKIWGTFFLSAGIFLLYLFVAKTIILIHGIVSGNTFIILPEGTGTFQEYLFLFRYALPFHGLWSLGKYLIGLLI